MEEIDEAHMKEKNIKILVAYHKPDVLIQSDILQPIHVGRSLLKKKCDTKSIENLKILQEEMIGDDTGENISDKNDSYNEMTAIYWAWKNYGALGDPDYIGLMHYRRHFYLNKISEQIPYFECNKIEDVESYINDTLGLTKNRLNQILKKNEILVSEPYIQDSVYDHYKQSHKIQDLDLVIKIIDQYYPQYNNACNNYLTGKFGYFCNMFIFPKNIFYKYCEFVFGVLEKFEKEVDIQGKRLFISERLTGIFIQSLLHRGKKITCAPTMYLEEKTTIPVAFAMDMNYLLPTFVAITSILENAKESTFYDIYIMVPKEVKEAAEKEAERYRQIYNGCAVTIIDMGAMLTDVQMKIRHITPQTYYRLYLSELLTQYDKCIYLDSDLIVEQDLSRLFRLNIDEFYVAGVRAAGYYYPEAKVKEHLKTVGLAGIDQYINAGVLLLNLKTIRNSKLYVEMQSYIRKGFPSQDQDIINLVCYNNIKILSLQFNFMTKYLHKSPTGFFLSKEDKDIYGEKKCEEARINPVIIHYADKSKPWNAPFCALASRWFTYFQHSPYYLHDTNNDVFETNEFAIPYDIRKNLSLRVLYEQKIEMMEGELNSLRSSFSFKVGRIITWFPRKCKHAIICLRYNGIHYTLIRIFGGKNRAEKFLEKRKDYEYFD